MTNFKLRVNGLLAGSLRWSMGYNCVSTAALATVASTFDTAVGTLWTTAVNGIQVLTNADVTVVNTTVYQVNQNWRSVSKQVTAHAIAGTDANPTTDYAQSPYVFMFSGVANTKSFRGHIKMPPLAEDQMLNGQLKAATVTSLKTVWQAFFTSMDALAGYQVVSYNRLTNKIGEVPFTAHQLVSFSIGSRPGTQRARKRKQLATTTQTGNL